MSDVKVPSLEAILAVQVRKSSPVPAYLQIAEAIRAAVRTIPLPPGTPLPPERVLSESVGVSKMTLRHAYDLLEREGVIDCRRGVGTFVAYPRVDKNLPEMRSFTEEMRARDKAPSSRLLSLRVTRGTDAARVFLDVSASEMVYEIQRLRLGDSIPIALEQVQVPARLFPNLERFDLATTSLYTIFEGSYKIQLVRCAEEISAVPPSKLQRKLLEIGPSVSLLVVTRRSYAINDTPMELAVTAYRGDVYTASTHAVRVGHSGEVPGFHRPRRNQGPDAGGEQS